MQTFKLSDEVKEMQDPQGERDRPKQAVEG